MLKVMKVSLIFRSHVWMLQEQEPVQRGHDLLRRSQQSTYAKTVRSSLRNEDDVSRLSADNNDKRNRGCFGRWQISGSLQPVFP